MTSSLTFPDSHQSGGVDRRKILTGAAALAASAVTMKTASAASVAPLGQTGAPTTATQPLPLGPLPGAILGALVVIGVCALMGRAGAEARPETEAEAEAT